MQKWGGAIQYSGITPQNYNTIIKYDLEDIQGRITSYYVRVLFGDGLPKLDIYTEKGFEITSKTEYVPSRFVITNTPDEGPVFTDGKIRGRGNATWNYEKKSYKLKFSSKTSLFGFPKNKDWILLADYNDRSLLRTAYMCEMSKAAEIKYTVNYKHISLYLNGEYQGIYLLTDKVEKSNDRINIKDDGYIIEDDTYYKDETFFVTDSLNRGFSFKYPDDVKEGDEKYNYIKTFVNNLEHSLLKLESDLYDTEYLKYIDLESFAKWFIATELINSIDPNLYFVLSSRMSKLEIYPMWDAEWSFGLTIVEWGKESNIEVLASTLFWNKNKYFKYLCMSPLFIKAIKAEWKKIRPRLDFVQRRIKKLEREIYLGAKSNFIKWDYEGFSNKVNVSFPTWEDEVAYLNSFLNIRIVYFDSYIESL